MEFYGVSIPLELQPSLALSVETEELGIAAGLQDRVIQVYEGLVYMNFSQDRVREQAGLCYGVYERLNPKLLPPVYIAYKADVSEPTEVFHNDIRSRYHRGERAVVEAMTKFAALAAMAREAIGAQDAASLGTLMDTNFDTRRSIYQLPPGQVEMIERARAVGATAKFAGSGGAIVGVYKDEAMFRGLEAELGKLQCIVMKPRIEG